MDLGLALQTAAGGLLLGGLYACIAAGFSLVWGVLNVINMLHGGFVVLGGYAAFYAWRELGLHPFLAALPLALLFYAGGALLQRGIINRLVDQPVLVTLTLTFALDLMLYNAMTVAFSATPRRATLDMGRLYLDEVVLPWDRIAAFGLALLVTLGLHLMLRSTRLGRAIVAVRMDRDAAALMGMDAKAVYAATFGLGAATAGACGALLVAVLPITTAASGLFLGKAFVVCVLGGLGSVPGALLGGLVLGVVESFASQFAGPQNAVTVGFLLMLGLLLVRPTGLLGRRGFE